MSSHDTASARSTILVVALLCFSVLPASNARQAGSLRIMGGDELTTHEIRYQASLRVDGYHVCGGTIISPKHILTAAHCLDGFNFCAPYDELSIVTGGLKLSETKNQHSIADITIHKDFVDGNEALWKHDIAVITLDNEIRFDQNQAPALLPREPISNGLSGVVSGWGRQSANSPYLSQTMRKANVRVMTSEECSPKIKYAITRSQICAFAAKDIGICQGDSGGPLVVGNTIVGITSWNIPCGTGVPDVFTNVYEHLDFINEVMQRSN